MIQMNGGHAAPWKRWVYRFRPISCDFTRKFSECNLTLAITMATPEPQTSYVWLSWVKKITPSFETVFPASSVSHLNSPQESGIVQTSKSRPRPRPQDKGSQRNFNLPKPLIIEPSNETFPSIADREGECGTRETREIKEKFPPTIIDIPSLRLMDGVDLAWIDQTTLQNRSRSHGRLPGTRPRKSRESWSQSGRYAVWKDNTTRKSNIWDPNLYNILGGNIGFHAPRCLSPVPYAPLPKERRHRKWTSEGAVNHFMDP